MSALKNFKYQEDEDGPIPSLVTGKEENINEVLGELSFDGGRCIVSEKKIDMANKQFEEKVETFKKVPVTIITGYLGSGKSTALEKLALKGSDRRMAIILNEFGDSNDIEKSMTIRNGENRYEEWLDLGNGCLCCSLKDVGIKAIENMIAHSPGKIDYILLETSGLADPGPIAKMFWLDEGLNSNIYIDGVVTVLDAVNISQCLDDISPEAHWHGENVFIEEKVTAAHLQLVMADVILLNKVDLAEEQGLDLEKVESRIRLVNSIAPIYRTAYGELPIEKVLDLHAFESFKLEQQPSGNFHDPRMRTVSMSFPALRDQAHFERFLENFLRPVHWKNYGQDLEGDWEIHRSKGLLLVGDECKVLQGVRDTFDIVPGRRQPGSDCCKLVFIGKDIDEDIFVDILKQFT
ncbi:LAMI_0G11672g1_1 [Lachancea mirantina]|uniref:LAMI_0G11672g1_1 n=1 Tax=Lachancea mirantina TaxID=1230905 RepID=A0A1G4KB44_9SACH|nr:LAMI_0G11672g1_1 [Lachancea mirantina]